jgi:cell division protease FtsH
VTDLAPAPVTEPVVPERTTRRRSELWDRTRILWLLAVLFAFFVWRRTDDNPLMSVADAARETWDSQRLIEILFGLEVVRQLHYLLSERSWRWHRLWSEGVFGRWQRFVERRHPWTRYRAARLAKFALVLAVLGLLLGQLWDMPALAALADAPGRFIRFVTQPSAGLPLWANIVLIFGLAIGQFVAIFWFLSRGGTDVFRPEEITERFTDVKGQEPVLREVREAVAFLDNPRAIEERGGRVPKGILLWGPPGTGKTLMAKAVAGETSKPFVFIEPAAFTNMFFGVGVLKVRSLYKKLRKLSLRHGGVIAFFDEADSLGSRGGAVASAAPAVDFGCTHWAGPASRRLLSEALDAVGTPEPVSPSGLLGRVRGIVMGGMGMGNGGGFGTVQALLTEMDGLSKPRGFLNRTVRRFLGMTPKPPLKYRILHMMATNLPDALDPAFLRPGRIDRIYHVGRPRSEGRESTYRYYLGKVTHALTDEQIHRLAVISDRGTGASIADIVNEAVIVALRNGHDAITYQDILRARYLKEHGPPDDFGYSDWESHAVAVHEACHAVAMYRLLKRDEIDVATIERRGDIGGFVAPIPLEEQFASWRSEIDHEVMTFLASLAGERLFFDGDNSQGVGGDLRASTAIVLRSFSHHGMGDHVASIGGVVGLVNAPQPALDGVDRQFLETSLGRQVDAHLQRLVGEVRTLLEQDRDNVLAIAHALEAHKTISGDDIVAIFEGGQGPMVDGARYHDPVVRAELETYHAAVVRAMHERGRVEHALPVVSLAPAAESPVALWPPPAPAPVVLFPPPAVPPTPPPGANGHNGGSPNGGSPNGVDYPSAPPTEE